MNALEIKNFTKRYGSTLAVDNISLTVKKGEFFGFLGPNGAGKTSTISCITGVGKFNEGNIKVFGLDAQKNYREVRQKIGISPQEFNVDIFAKVEKILWFSGGFFGMSRSSRTKRIKEVLKIMELEEHKDKVFRALSGGLKRRLMLARSIMHNPELLILDEPTHNLDEIAVRNLIEIIHENVSEFIDQTFIITHDERLAESANKVVKLV